MATKIILQIVIAISCFQHSCVPAKHEGRNSSGGMFDLAERAGHMFRRGRRVRQAEVCLHPGGASFHLTITLYRT